jgi:hypothetical protein
MVGLDTVMREDEGQRKGEGWKRCHRRRCQGKREENLARPPPLPTFAPSAAVMLTTPASLVVL